MTAKEFDKIVVHQLKIRADEDGYSFADLNDKEFLVLKYDMALELLSLLESNSSTMEQREIH